MREGRKREGRGVQLEWGGGDCNLKLTAWVCSALTHSISLTKLLSRVTSGSLSLALVAMSVLLLVEN